MGAAVAAEMGVGASDVRLWCPGSAYMWAVYDPIPTWADSTRRLLQHPPENPQQ